MNYFASIKDAVGMPGPGHVGFGLLDEKNGCKNGCCCGISHYTETEYSTPGCHEDQEGFIVLSGSGSAKIGEQEQAVAPGVAFIAPAGTPHALRTDDPEVPLEVFWFHAAC